MRKTLIVVLVVFWGSGMALLSYELWLNQRYTLKLEGALYEMNTQNQLLLHSISNLQQRYQKLKGQCEGDLHPSQESVPVKLAEIQSIPRKIGHGVVKSKAETFRGDVFSILLRRLGIQIMTPTQTNPGF